MWLCSRYLMVPPVSQNASVVTGLSAGVGVDEVLRLEGWQRVVEVLKQIGLRSITFLVVTSQLSGVVVFERGSEFVQEVEHFTGSFVR